MHAQNAVWQLVFEEIFDWKNAGLLKFDACKSVALQNPNQFSMIIKK